MKERSPITSHVLDTSRGRPAAGVNVLLESQVSAKEWKAVKTSVTNADGRVEDLMAPGVLQVGVYRLTFETQAYFRAQKIQSFYPHVCIVFEVTAPKEHHHVPLLLNPFGYSTYRGS